MTATTGGVDTYFNEGSSTSAVRRLLDDHEKPAPIPATRSSICLSRSSRFSRTSKPDVDPSVFRDKIVFVGVTASASLRRVQERRSPGAEMPGIQVHAAVADRHSLQPVSSARQVTAAASRPSSAAGLLVGLVATSAAGMVGDRRHDRLHRRVRLDCHAAVRRRILAESLSTGSGVVRPRYLAGVAYQYFVEVERRAG